MNSNFDSKEYRDAFVESMIRTGIAFQIKELRKAAKWSQAELGDHAGKPQNVISRLEDPSYGSFTLKTLLELASAFDVALVVKFASFSELHSLSRNRSPEALAVPSYQEEKQGFASARSDNTNVRQHSKVTPIETARSYQTGGSFKTDLGDTSSIMELHHAETAGY